MKYCPNCKVTVRGSSKLCPLCQGPLVGESTPEPYPDIPTIYKQYQLFFKLLALSNVAAGIISVMLNVMLPEHGWWSGFVLVGIACFWVMLAFAIRKRNNVVKTIMYQTILVMIFSLIWDALTGWRGWSVNFVLPIAPVVCMAGSFVSSLVLHVPLEDYVMYIVFGGVLGFIPLILNACGQVTLPLPTYIGVTICAIALSAVLIFVGGRLLTEFQKRFHI